MAEEKRIDKKVFEPRIKLNVGMTGKYGWELTFYGEDIDKVIAELETTDQKLKEKFGYSGDPL